MKLASKDMQKYRIRTRDGYRLKQQAAFTNPHYLEAGEPLEQQRQPQ